MPGLMSEPGMGDVFDNVFGEFAAEGDWFWGYWWLFFFCASELIDLKNLGRWGLYLGL